MTRHIHSVVAAVLTDVMRPVQCSCGEELVIVCPKGCTDAELNASARRLIKERRQMSPVLMRESKNSTPRFEPRVEAAAVPVKRIPLESAKPASKPRFARGERPAAILAILDRRPDGVSAAFVADELNISAPNAQIAMLNLMRAGHVTRQDAGGNRGYLYSRVAS